jgi:hypothetical protein
VDQPTRGGEALEEGRAQGAGKVRSAFRPVQTASRKLAPATREQRDVDTPGLFHGYRLRVANLLRDYSLDARDQAPTDSRAIHG